MHYIMYIKYIYKKKFSRAILVAHGNMLNNFKTDIFYCNLDSFKNSVKNDFWKSVFYSYLYFLPV